MLDVPMVIGRCLAVGLLVGTPALAAAQNQGTSPQLFRGATAAQGTIGPAGATLEIASGARLEVAGEAASGQAVSMAVDGATVTREPRIVVGPEVALPLYARADDVVVAVPLDAEGRGSGPAVALPAGDTVFTPPVALGPRAPAPELPPELK